MGDGGESTICRRRLEREASARRRCLRELVLRIDTPERLAETWRVEETWIDGGAAGDEGMSCRDEGEWREGSLSASGFSSGSEVFSFVEARRQSHCLVDSYLPRYIFHHSFACPFFRVKGSCFCSSLVAFTCLLCVLWHLVSHWFLLVC